jgi:hypothetical protein
MRINTGIKSTAKYNEILNAVIGQMSDGIWENTRSMEKYWKSLNLELSQADEIILVDNWGVCSDVADFFANKIKQIIKIEIDDGNSKLFWDRSCSGLTHYLNYHLDITVGDCYQLYELLKGRNTSKHTYASYKDYTVDVTYGGITIPVKVKALNESKARTAAIEVLSKGATFSATLA